jgi:hypothetical protein
MKKLRNLQELNLRFNPCRADRNKLLPALAKNLPLATFLNASPLLSAPDTNKTNPKKELQNSWSRFVLFFTKNWFGIRIEL